MPIFCSLLYSIYWKAVGTLIWPVNLRFLANLARILVLFTFTSCNIFYGIRSSRIFHETHFSCLLILSRYGTQNKRKIFCLHNWIRMIRNPVVRIHIHFIRIQHFRLNTDPDLIRFRIQTGSRVLMSKNWRKKIYILQLKN